MPYKLLFVCLGNICRSPSAENIMRHLVAEAGLSDQIHCDSAGTSSYHVGAAPDRRMQGAARKQGIKLVGQSRQFTRADFENFDLIVAMDNENYRNIVSLDAERKYGQKVVMMCDYADNFRDSEVPDPYYGGDSGFDHVIDLLMDACSGLLKTVKQEL
ncbi:MAG: low molecular weight protein-tyrosine-phosphatase [Limnothrix sp.]